MNLPASLSETIECKSLDEASSVLAQVKSRLQSPPTNEMLESFGRAVHLRTIKNFLDSETPDGVPWAPLKRPRAGWRADIRHKILIKTGMLFGSASQATASPTITGGGQSANLDIEAETPWYGAKHITGTKNMPARPWLGVSDTMVDDFADEGAGAMQAWFVTGTVVP